MRDAKVERESAAAERVAIAENVAAAETAGGGTRGRARGRSRRVVASRAKEHDDATKELAKCRAKMAACDEEAAALRKKQTRIERAADADAVERKKLEHKIARVEKEAAEGKARCAKLEEEHPWIASEASRFGVRGGEYDWASRDPDAAAAELADAEAAQATLAKRINKKVIAMFDKAEGEFKALQEKRRIVLDDRKKIQDVIGELDEKKKEALSVTWNKVNADFGSIFSTLLPGTSAKLEPPEARSSITLVPIRPRRRGERRSLRTSNPGVSLHPSPLAFNPDTPRRLSTSTDAFQLQGESFLAGLEVRVAVRGRVERVAHRAERRAAVAARAVAHPRASAVQARADLHSRRGGRRVGLVAHAKHRPHDRAVLSVLAVHRRVVEGGDV